MNAAEIKATAIAMIEKSISDRMNKATGMTPELLEKLEAQKAKIVAVAEAQDDEFFASVWIVSSPALSMREVMKKLQPLAY